MMYNYILDKHPQVASVLNNTQGFSEMFEKYVGSRISLSPVVLSVSANGMIIDLLDNPLITMDGYDIKIKEIIDIKGNAVDWDNSLSSSGNYSIRTKELDELTGTFSWLGTSIYIDGTVHIICYCYPKLKIGKEWSDIMLLFLIPYTYYNKAMEDESFSDASMYQTYLNRLINLYNKVRVVPMVERISLLGEIKPYEL
ncbi:MAG: hypothetical protein WC175_01055 [Candidatus Dojkabacteria bacterium]